MGILSSLLGFGESAPTPTGGTVVQTTELAKEIAPFMQDLLKKGQALYKARTDEGYRPYEGQTQAALTPEQEQAMAGISGLVGTTAPVFQEATDLSRGVAQQMTPELTQQYMSPYQQAVTDLDKAEAQKTFERDVLPKVRQAQIGAGAFGGTRGTMLEAQALADQQKLLGDIQTRGSQAAYQDAVRAFEAQKGREGATASALANLAPQALKTAGTEFELLRGVGQEKQQRSQQALDEAYKQYLEERVFPEQTLGQYQSVIAGFPSASTTRTVQKTTQPQPSGLGSLLGTIGNVGSLYGTFGGFSQGGIGSGYYPMGSSRAHGGMVYKEFGGQIGEGGLVNIIDGINVWARTQEGISNRSIHGGILEGDDPNTAIAESVSSTTPVTSSTSVSPLPKTATGGLADLDSVQQKGGVYNASEFKDFGSTLPRPSDAPETIVQNVEQVGSMYRDPHTGKIPYSLYRPQPVSTFGQGYDLKNVDYFTANQLALNEGADRFMYNNEYAATDPGLLSNYDYTNLGTKPYSDSMERDKIREATIGMPMSGGMGQAAVDSPEVAMKKAQGFTMGYSGRYDVPGTPPAERYRQLVDQGVNMDSQYTRQMFGFKQGGLVDLPVVKRQMSGTTDVPISNEAAYLQRMGIQLPEGITSISQLSPKDMQALGIDINLQRMFTPRASDQAYQDIVTARQAGIEDTRDMMRQQALIRALRGFGTGVKEGAGQGIFGEISSGIAGAADATIAKGEEDANKLLDLKAQLDDLKLKATLAREAGDDATADKLMTIAGKLREDELKQEAINAQYLANQRKLNQFNIGEYTEDNVRTFINNIITGMGGKELLDAGYGVLATDGSMYTTEDLQNQAQALATEEFLKQWDAGDIRIGTEKIVYPQIVEKYIKQIVGESPKAQLLKAKGGQVIKKKKGSMIDEPVKQQTTAEVLQELKGLRK